MCGIVGYIGPGACREILLAGLARLEYRGYDSAGIALLNGDLKVSKCAGRVRDLEARSIDLPATAAAGIGHTRWATHGGPSDANAHPHVGPSGTIAQASRGPPPSRTCPACWRSRPSCSRSRPTSSTTHIPPDCGAASGIRLRSRGEPITCDPSHPQNPKGVRP
jgi:hypothetical protein